MMNRRIQAAAQISNPFHFKHIFNLATKGGAGMDAIEDAGPCVVMASPGMLQNGLSRELLEMWAGDAENGCVMTGYAGQCVFFFGMGSRRQCATVKEYFS